MSIVSYVKNLKTRMLIGVVLGCDVHAGGCHNVGPHKLNKFIESVSDEDKDIGIALTEHIADDMKCDVEDVSIYADSILCEPTNEVSLRHDAVISNYEHLNEDPKCMSSYLMEHVCPGASGCTMINDETKTHTCKGCDDESTHEHTFIENRTCASCQENTCQCCCSKVNNSDVILCIGCFKNQLSHGVSEHHGKNLDQMMKEIKNAAHGGGHTCLNELSLSEM